MAAPRLELGRPLQALAPKANVSTHSTRQPSFPTPHVSGDGPPESRTPNPLIKSQLLCQLS